ncbi:hypothetical protein M426DRAFT_166158 [Hypoxylon sp. CI-4A]|nr:hypothetical protein M426DRAFT_166158 [Hypoxylon sp. CI-4A]
MRSPEALFDIRRRSTGFGTTASGFSPAPRNPFSNNGFLNKDALNSSSLTGRHASSSQASASPVSRSPFSTPAQKAALSVPPTPSDNHQSFSRALDPSDPNQGPTAQLHPAIRAQYAAMIQRGSGAHDANGGGTLFTTPTQPQAVVSPVLYQTTSNPVPAPVTSVNSDVYHANEAGSPPISNPDQKQSPHANSNPTRTPNMAKQTYIPPPRPWESLRRTQGEIQFAQNSPSLIQGISSSTTNFDPLAQAPTPTPIPNIPSPYVPENGPADARHISNAGLEPSNVSGPFSQKFPQTVPNNNSHSPVNYGQLLYLMENQSPRSSPPSNNPQGAFPPHQQLA